MLSPTLQATLQSAAAIASEYGHEFVTLEHLLLAMTDDEDALALFNRTRVDAGRLADELKTILPKICPVWLNKRRTTRNRPSLSNAFCNAPPSKSNRADGIS